RVGSDQSDAFVQAERSTGMDRMNVFAEVEARVLAALEALAKEGALPAGLDVSAVAVETPRDPAHGDLACNAAMVLAKQAKMKPRDRADLLKARLESDPDIATIDIAGPGFLNLRMRLDFWQA